MRSDGDICEDIANRIADDAWVELQMTPYVQLRMSTGLERLPEVTFEQAQRRSEVGRALLKRIDQLDWGRLSHDAQLTLRLVKFQAQSWSREADWYWVVIDPLGTGYFGLFLPSAYCGGRLLAFVNNQLASYPLQDDCDLER